MPYISFKDLIQLKEDVKDIRELNLENIKEMTKMVDEEKKREKKEYPLLYWRQQYIKISNQKIKNAVQMEKIMSEKDNIDGKLENIANIINEHQKKKFGKIHIDYLEQFCKI